MANHADLGVLERRLRVTREKGSCTVDGKVNEESSLLELEQKRDRAEEQQSEEEGAKEQTKKEKEGVVTSHVVEQRRGEQPVKGAEEGVAEVVLDVDVRAREARVQGYCDDFINANACLCKLRVEADGGEAERQYLDQAFNFYFLPKSPVVSQCNKSCPICFGTYNSSFHSRRVPKDWETMLDAEVDIFLWPLDLDHSRGSSSDTRRKCPSILICMIFSTLSSVNSSGSLLEPQRPALRQRKSMTTGLSFREALSPQVNAWTES